MTTEREMLICLQKRVCHLVKIRGLCFNQAGSQPTSVTLGHKSFRYPQIAAFAKVRPLSVGYLDISQSPPREIILKQNNLWHAVYSLLGSKFCCELQSNHWKNSFWTICQITFMYLYFSVLSSEFKMSKLGSNPALSVIGCEILGELLNYFKSLFLNWENVIINAHFIEFLVRL